MSSYSVAFPTSGNSPYSGYAAVVPQQGAVQPGSITYTTSTLPDGRIQYQMFRAEARSYPTPQGVVHGIQWTPTSVSYDIPVNAYPAGPEFLASWSRSSKDKEAQRAIKEWQRDQEKQARKEEKESAKRIKEWEKERREREKAEERELRKMQERAMQRPGRERRLSDVGYAAEYQTYSASGRSHTRSRSRVRADDVGQEDITRMMAEMAMDRGGEGSRRERERERRNSGVARSRKPSINERPLYPTEYERTRKLSGVPYPTHNYPSAAYGAPPSPRRASYSNKTSPYVGGVGLPVSGATGPVYPPGHIYAGRPIPHMQGENLGVISSFTTPSPSRSALQLESPAGFSRPPSLAAPYTYFEPIQILRDLNSLFHELPLLPAVIVPHDVWPEDWNRCFEDVARAWHGDMPHVGMKLKKPHTVVSQLIDVWNGCFFSLRGVELVLFYGRQRRSGPRAGRHDSRLGISGDSDSESISSVSEDTDAEERDWFYKAAHAHYGSGNPWLAESMQARRVRKSEKKLREKEKRKRSEREREKAKGSGFSLYLTCTGDGQPPRAYLG